MQQILNLRQKMNLRHFQFLSNICSYRPFYILLRVAVVSIVGLCFMFASNSVSEQPLNIPYITLSITYVVITELNVLLNFAIHRYGSNLLREYQFTTHFILNILLCALAAIIVFPMAEETITGNIPLVRLTMGFSMIFIILIILVIVLLRILRDKIEAEKEIEELKQIQIQNDYQILMEQVNPHFLFNNLSVLKSLILYDKEKALTFTQNFTDIYRYVLQSKDKNSVSLAEELDFVKAYIDLHKERIGDGLQVEINIPKESLQKSILPLALQILVENALKHNIASKSQPLHIVIEAKDSKISVVNNLNKKDTTYSTKKGLDNITKRYKLLTDNKVEIQQNEKEFKVTLPLI